MTHDAGSNCGREDRNHLTAAGPCCGALTKPTEILGRAGEQKRSADSSGKRALLDRHGHQGESSPHQPCLLLPLWGLRVLLPVGSQLTPLSKPADESVHGHDRLRHVSAMGDPEPRRATVRNVQGGERRSSGRGGTSVRGAVSQVWHVEIGPGHEHVPRRSVALLPLRSGHGQAPRRARVRGRDLCGRRGHEATVVGIPEVWTAARPDPRERAAHRVPKSRGAFAPHGGVWRDNSRSGLEPSEVASEGHASLRRARPHEERGALP